MVNYTPGTIGVQNGARKMMEDWWLLVRTLRGGTKAMRLAGQAYLPMTAQETQKPPLYQSRLNGTRLFPAYDRAVVDLAAMPFQKAPTLTGVELLPPQLAPMVENADRCGTSLWSFMRQIHEDAIDRGLGLFMADSVPTDGTLTLDVVDRIDARPYFARIHPDNLVGFVSETVLGKERIVDLRIRETGTETINGADTIIERIRHWDATMVELWERRTMTQQSQQAMADLASGSGSAQSAWVMVDSRPHGFPDGIPVVPHYTRKLATLTAQPPLEDLAWENVAHWQSRSLQDEALKYCRSPILHGRGLSSDQVKMRPVLGAGATVLSEAPDTEWSFVEITGSSLMAGERQIEKIEATIRALAMEPLVQNGGPDTATGELRADMRDKAAAQQWAEGLEWAFYEGFRMLCQWLNKPLPEDFDLTLFRDWAILGPGAAQDVAMMQVDAREGRMSRRAYLEEMVRRGKRKEGFDIEAEMEEIDTEAERKVERQMMAMAAQVVADRPENQPPQDGEDDPADDPKAEPKDDPVDGGGAAVTFNELTLGAERAARQGNIEGANKLWAEAADLIGVAGLGKVRKAVPTP